MLERGRWILSQYFLITLSFCLQSLSTFFLYSMSLLFCPFEVFVNFKVTESPLLRNGDWEVIEVTIKE